MPDFPLQKISGKNAPAQSSPVQNILLLGGTTEASQLAQHLAQDRAEDLAEGPQAGRQVVFSYAGRTARPAPQPLPQRLGGFGGVAGLVNYIRREGVTHVIDATHPFAARMSANAVAACAETGVALCAFERAPWQPSPQDHWIHVPSITEAVMALPQRPGCVFLAIGKQHLAPFAAKPQHHYVLRLVDAPTQDLPLPQTSVIVARGPFKAAQDEAMMRDHAVTHIVAKNAGGQGAEAKILAARALGLPVIMVDRPNVPDRTVCATVGDVMDWLNHRDQPG